MTIDILPEHLLILAIILFLVEGFAWPYKDKVTFVSSWTALAFACVVGSFLV